MPKRIASAEWDGSLQEGNGLESTASVTFENAWLSMEALLGGIEPFAVVPAKDVAASGRVRGFEIR